MGHPQKQLLNEHEYLTQKVLAKEKHEKVDGMIYAIAGAGERHNRITLHCAVALRAGSKGTSCRVYISDMKLRLNHGRGYCYPDVMLRCEPATPDTPYKEAPCLVAEVLSPSTASIDTREKLQAYRSIASLRYDLIIDADSVAVRCYSGSAANEWLTSTLDRDENLTIECGAVQASLPLHHNYENTPFKDLNHVHHRCRTQRYARLHRL